MTATLAFSPIPTQTIINGTKAGTGKYLKNSVSGRTNASIFEKEPTKTPNGTPMTIANKKPFIIREKLIHVSVANDPSIRLFTNASTTAVGAGKKIWLTIPLVLNSCHKTKTKMKAPAAIMLYFVFEIIFRSLIFVPVFDTALISIKSPPANSNRVTLPACLEPSYPLHPHTACQYNWNQKYFLDLWAPLKPSFDPKEISRFL